MEAHVKLTFACLKFNYSSTYVYHNIISTFWNCRKCSVIIYILVDNKHEYLKKCKKEQKFLKNILERSEHI